MAHARERASETGQIWYVRGFQRTISNYGKWLYGAYERPDPKIMADQFPMNPRRSVRQRGRG